MSDITQKIQTAVQQIQSNQFSLAAAILHEVLSENPDHPDALNLRGMVYDLQGEPQNAVGYLLQATTVRPKHAESWNNLGLAYLSLHNRLKAEEAFRNALGCQPEYVEAAYNLSRTLLALDKIAEAESWAKRVIHSAPQIMQAHILMANIKEVQGDTDAAITGYEKAIALGYSLPDGSLKLAELYQVKHQLYKAESCFQQVLRVQPQDYETQCKFGIVLMGMGKHQEAAEAFRAAVKYKPDFVNAQSYLLLLQHYMPEVGAQQLSKQAFDWAKPFNQTNIASATFTNKDAGKKLKVGFISSDLRNHPVGTFLFPLLVASDASCLEFVLYYNNDKEDWMSESLKKHAKIWRNIYAFSDAVVAQQIRDDGIDILIDLNGHTPKNRLLMMTQKPAPMQATWLGYFNTTGLSAIDYIICDEVIIPAKDEALYSEKPLRLPNSYLCYAPPDYDLMVAPLPALKNGFITFGSFNYYTKITDEVIACWMEILSKVPNSKLLVKNPSFADDEVKKSFLAACAKYGDASRVDAQKGAPQKEFMATYQQVDIALDTFPYNGGTTTIESLWMGVPVVTLSGDHFVSRVSHSILKQLPLGDFITHSKQAYVDTCVALSSETQKLADIRTNLRKNVMESQLCNAKQFATDFEQALRGAWGQLCEQKKAA
jgi:predicted O-linked N-acetylglucosamine transferase (SPINDLY family)